MKYYLQAFKKYAVFKGRATRREYWTFLLFNVLAYLVLYVIEYMLGMNSEGDQGTFVGLYQLAVLLPSWAVSVRRMHDVNKSGWNILIPIYSLILFLRKGTKGDNQYGQDPNELNEKLEPIPDLKEKSESTFCYKCGEALELDSNFCTKCGTKAVVPPKE